MWFSRVVASLELRFNGRDPDMLSDDLMDSVGRSRLHVSRSTPSCRT
jgi:hypothetical protein